MRTNHQSRKLKQEEEREETMKKLLVLILLVTMLLPVVGMAEFDLINMTDEQLLLLNKKLMAELFSREKTALVPIGRYVIGEDIPEGEYELANANSNPETQMTVQYVVFENLEKRKQGEYDFVGYLSTNNKPTPNSRIKLKSGNVLQINYEGILMKKSNLIIEFK